MNNNSLTTIARKYVGLKGFSRYDTQDARFFRHDLGAAGWDKGDALDMGFVRMCYIKFYGRYGKFRAGIRELRFKNTHAACLGIKHSPYWITHTDTPEPGDLMFCRYKWVGNDYYVCIVDRPTEGSTFITTFETPTRLDPNWEGERTLVKNSYRRADKMTGLELVFFARLRDPDEAKVRYGDKWK